MSSIEEENPMHKFSHAFAGAAIILAILACNLPSNTGGAEGAAAVLTAAALTVQAEINTATPGPAASPASATDTPTPTPIPLLPSATSTSNCDSALFITDVTYPDNTIVPAGSSFTKTWRLQNTGGCSWTPSYAVVFVGGDAMSGPSVQGLTGNVNPGQTDDISVNLKAPASNGTYTGNWGLRNAAGVVFTHFFVQIKVATPAAFTVTKVTFAFTTWSSGSYVSCPEVVAHITTNGAGTVTYHWTRSDGASAPTETLIFASAGTQTINDQWSLGSYWTSHVPAGGFWMGIYIDSPNNQNFGHKTFTTACTSP
jgi:hypothetical protein